MEDENNVSDKFSSAEELETYTVKCLLTNQTLLSRFMSSLSLDFFQVSSNEVIFKIIKSYYNDFQIKIPKDEVFIRLEMVLPKTNVQDKNKELRELCLSSINEMYNGEEINVESANRNICNFILKRQSEKSLTKLVNTLTDTSTNNDYKEKSFYAIEECVKEIRDSTKISIGNKEPFNLADIDRIEEIRKDALGDGDNNKIVKLYLQSMNNIMQYKGIGVGSVVCVMATPGSGKSTFLINQGLNSAMQGLKVCHCFIGDMEYLDGLIRYYTCYTETENSKISIANRLLEKDITLRKRALLRYKEGTDSYERNQKIIDEEEQKLAENQRIDEELERTGKKKIVLNSRQMAEYSSEDLKLLLTTDEKFMKIGSNVDIYKYAASEISMDALREEIYNYQKQKGIHYDVIIVDYDGNLKQPAESMYESGGIIYDQAKNLAQVNHSVVFMASQPKQSFWKNELIPIEACAESSKKQMIIDMLITIGRPEGVNTGIRKIFVAKNRRGDENEIFHARLNGSTGFMYEIFQDEYEKLKKQGYDPTLVISKENNNNNNKNKNIPSNESNDQNDLKNNMVELPKTNIKDLKM